MVHDSSIIRILPLPYSLGVGCITSLPNRFGSEVSTIGDSRNAGSSPQASPLETTSSLSHTPRDSRTTLPPYSPSSNSLSNAICTDIISKIVSPPTHFTVLHPHSRKLGGPTAALPILSSNPDLGFLGFRIPSVLVGLLQSDFLPAPFVPLS
ncbi:hypothetical protein PM082_002312 [Marasmius tenuissimus]|nr:hypothetical protein PM082_002312 [Marasmius tenuissimus]